MGHRSPYTYGGYQWTKQVTRIIITIVKACHAITRTSAQVTHVEDIRRQPTLSAFVSVSEELILSGLKCTKVGS